MRFKKRMKTVQYDATYKIGNTTIHVVAPPPMTEEKKEKIIAELHAAGWAILLKNAEDEQREKNQTETRSGKADSADMR